MKDNIVVIGGGGHAKVIINTIKKLDNYTIIGYTDNVNKGLLLGVKYLGTDANLLEIFEKYNKCSAAISVGGVTISNKRLKIYDMLKAIGFELPVIISKEAVVSEEVSIGEGTVVLENAVINVNSKIGKCVIVNNGTVVDHDCVIGDFVHLTPLTRIGFGAKIGKNAFIGSGAVILQNKMVLENCFVGAGTVLTEDTMLEGTYLGVPAFFKSNGKYI